MQDISCYLSSQGDYHLVTIFHRPLAAYTFRRKPLPAHAKPHTVALYTIKTPIATVSDAYIVSILTFTRPVARLQIKKNARPLRLIASSNGGTAAVGPVDEGKKAISTVKYPRRKVVLYAAVHRM